MCPGGGGVRKKCGGPPEDNFWNSPNDQADCCLSFSLVVTVPEVGWLSELVSLDARAKMTNGGVTEHRCQPF